MNGDGKNIMGTETYSDECLIDSFLLIIILVILIIGAELLNTDLILRFFL